MLRGEVLLEEKFKSLPSKQEKVLKKPNKILGVTRTALPWEELPQPPASGALACGPTSGARLLLALEPQEGCWTKEFKEYLTQGTLPEKEEDAEASSSEG